MNSPNLSLAELLAVIAVLTLSSTGAVLIVSAFRKTARGRYDDFITAILFVAIGGISKFSLGQSSKPPLDPQFLKVDALLGFNPLHWFRVAHEPSHSLLMAFLLIVYVSLSSAMAAAWLMEQNHVMRRALVIGWAFVWMFYYIAPAVGPGIYDWTLNTSTAPRDCLPSMHMTWALLLAINTRIGWWRNLLWLYAALIAASTIATGQHYLIDLIAAIPYTAAVQWVASRNLQWRDMAARVHTLNVGRIPPYPYPW